MIYTGRHRNPGVRYQYIVDKPPPVEKPENQYRWKQSNWTPCSKTCGSGYRKQQVVCVNHTGGMCKNIFM